MESETDTNQPVEATAFTPESRQRGEFTAGAPAVLSDGIEWMLPLATQSPILSQLRDRLFDDQEMTGNVALGDIVEGAYTLLYLAYDLSSDEIMGLLANCDKQRLADAVLACVIGADKGHRTYDQWVRSALLANGIEPSGIPPTDLPNVLRHLVKTGRVEEAASFISSMDAAAQRKKIIMGLR